MHAKRERDAIVGEQWGKGQGKAKVGQSDRYGGTMIRLGHFGDRSDEFCFSKLMRVSHASRR